MSSGFEIFGRIGTRISQWAIDSQGRGQVFAASESEDRYINQASGKVWSVSLDTTGLSGGATQTYDLSANPNGVYIAYMKNTSSEHFHLTDQRVIMSEGVTIEIDRVQSSALANNATWDTDWIPTTGMSSIQSRFLGKNVFPSGNMYYASASGGITGLTKKGTMFPSGDVNNVSSHLHTSSNIIIPVGGEIAIRLVGKPGATAVSGKFLWSLVEIKHQINGNN